MNKCWLIQEISGFIRKRKIRFQNILVLKNKLHAFYWTNIHYSWEHFILKKIRIHHVTNIKCTHNFEPASYFILLYNCFKYFQFLITFLKFLKENLNSNNLRSFLRGINNWVTFGTVRHLALISRTARHLLNFLSRKDN